MPKRILVVDDEQPIVESISYTLRKEGYETIVAYDGQEAIERARAGKPDLIILDLMLPELSGFEVCRILQREMDVPIIMLTAKGEEADKVLGLKLGADDYVTKPFSMKELLARIEAVLRRTGERAKLPEGKEKYQVGELFVDLSTHETILRGKKIELTPKEFDLLVALISRAGKVLTRDELLTRVWGSDFYGDERTLDVHIRRLREKIEKDPSHPEYILTVHSLGYKFSSEVKKR